MNDVTQPPQGDEQGAEAAPTGKKRRKSLSMHDDVAIWHDTCPCEAEPYWAEVAEELGIDLSAEAPDEPANKADEQREEGSGKDAGR